MALSSSLRFLRSDREIVLIFTVAFDALHIQDLAIQRLRRDGLEEYVGAGTFEHGVVLTWNWGG